ncbi:MAG: Asp-tRNA(Asn)/Glu-tRNA(Gln) amidotransferase subunit GatB [Candidatus Moraniibacteriota bacterium]|nr:MAG: Asp-tRNA(Asn)/Glu-tRNA(Gln) amidotransferase subunit GatB [Candidatus Moranbacteria bacterium]
MANYEATIGMEVHAELKTASKMFCSCKNGLGLETTPNVNICQVCTAQPGALPVPNARAIEAVQKVGLALNCALRFQSKFDRKNYFYPDLPKGYQISQYDEPFCEAGTMEIDGKPFRITRIHLEEDTGKSMHPEGADYTLVDYNRAGVPLMELVTEPDFSTAKDARAFCQKLRQILRYLEVSDADMEKGQMRCEVNISLHKVGEDRLSGTKVEIKNLNSFRSVERSIEYEIKRQTEALENGETIVQETRGWDEGRGITVSQRKKESAHDYRYFPEPDIPPFVFTQADIERLKADLPELPDAKVKRLVVEYGLPVADTVILTEEKEVASYFEAVVSELGAKIDGGETKAELPRMIKLAANYFITEVRKYLTNEGRGIEKLPITAENYAEFIVIVADGKINSSAAQTVLKEMLSGADGDTDPSHIIDRLNLAQMSDTGELESIVDTILSNNAQSVADFKAGKQNAFQYLIGQVMKETKGKANPQMVSEILKKKLS